MTRGLALAGRELLVIDIGGGSSEFIRGNDGGVSQMLSVDVGSVRLTERFLHSDPVRGDEIVAMLAAIDRELAPVIASLASTNAALTLVGIAGSFTTLAAIEKASSAITPIARCMAAVLASARCAGRFSSFVKRPSRSVSRSPVLKPSAPMSFLPAPA